MFTIGAPLKYEEKSSASRVALIKISLSSGRWGRSSLRTISRKSVIKKGKNINIQEKSSENQTLD